VDDHPAVRAGLVALLEAEPALVVLPPAAGATEALTLARQQLPEVALVDVSLGDGSGLCLCLDLKEFDHPPGVVLYTAAADPALSLKARLAGADGLVGKDAPADELRRALKRVGRGEAFAPRPDREVVAAQADRLSAEDLAIVGLRLESASVEDVADTLGLPRAEIMGRLERLLCR